MISLEGLSKAQISALANSGTINLSGGFSYNYFSCSFIWDPHRVMIVPTHSK